MAKSKVKKKSTQPSKKWQFYADGKKNRKTCPNCGDGVFLGFYKNPDRYHCGKCSYTEYVTSNN